MKIKILKILLIFQVLLWGLVLSWPYIKSEPPPVSPPVSNSVKYLEELPLSFKQQDMVRDMINTFNLGTDEYFVYGLIYTESRFKIFALSEYNAMGLTQIVPSTFNSSFQNFSKEYPELKHLVINDPYDVNTNIIICLYYLKELKTKFAGIDKISDNPHMILTMYNYGPTGAREYYKNNHTWKSKYSSQVLKASEHLKNHGHWREYKYE